MLTQELQQGSGPCSSCKYDTRNYVCVVSLSLSIYIYIWEYVTHCGFGFSVLGFLFEGLGRFKGNPTI